MAAPTAVIRPNTTGPYPAGPEGMLAEPLQVTGDTSVVGDTFSYVSQFINDPQMVSPGYSIQSITKSGPTTTTVVELQHAIGAADVEDIELIGFMG